MKCCHRCKHEWSEAEPPGFNNTCENCGIGLHSCSNCGHYRSQGQHRCVLPGTPRVLDAVGSNRCDSFAFREHDLEAESAAEAAGGMRATDALDDVKPTWDQLFG